MKYLKKFNEGIEKKIELTIKLDVDISGFKKYGMSEDEALSELIYSIRKRLIEEMSGSYERTNYIGTSYFVKGSDSNPEIEDHSYWEEK